MPADLSPLSTVIPRLPPVAAAKKSAMNLRPFILLIVVGAALGYLVGKHGRGMIGPFLGPRDAVPLALVALPLQWLLVVAWHEAGHVIGGWSIGGKFLLYVVGPFMWRRTPSGVRFSWNRNVNLMGGLASCLPLDAALATPRRLAVMIAGGPVFSLLLATAALWGGALLAQMHLPGKSWAFAQQFLLFTALLSLVIFVVTAYPAMAGGFKTDGRRFLDLLRGDTRSEQEKALIALTTAALAGVRPADYDPKLVAQSLALRDRSLFDLYAHLTAYGHEADLGEFSRAQAMLDYVIADEGKLTPYARDAARCEYAWLLATQTTDAAAARAWLDSAGPASFDPATRLRAEAAVLLREGKNVEAAVCVKLGLHALAHRSLSPRVSTFHVEALEEILKRATNPNIQHSTSNIERPNPGR